MLLATPLSLSTLIEEEHPYTQTNQQKFSPQNFLNILYLKLML
jgi:hypothetical protein